MAYTLDPALAARMDSEDRYPIIELISKEPSESIPFVGQRLTARTQDETYHRAIEHTTGRVLIAFLVDDSGWKIIYGYTDTDRVTWAWDEYALTVSHAPLGMSLTELANGDVGMTWFEYHGADRYLKYQTIPVTGGAATAAGTIEAIGNVYVSGPRTIRLLDDTYLMAYVQYDTGTTHYHIYTRTSADFETWAAANEEDDGLDATYKKANPSLKQLENGDVYLWFDRVDSIGPNSEELTNIYYLLGTSTTQEEHEEGFEDPTGYDLTGWTPSDPDYFDPNATPPAGTSGWGTECLRLETEGGLEDITRDWTPKAEVNFSFDFLFPEVQDIGGYGAAELTLAGHDGWSHQVLAVLLETDGDGGAQLTYWVDTPGGQHSYTLPINWDTQYGVRFTRDASGNWAFYLDNVLNQSGNDAVTTDIGSIGLWADLYGGDVFYIDNVYVLAGLFDFTFAAAEKHSNFTGYGLVGKNPVAVQKQANQMTLAYDLIRGSLSWDNGTDGWPGDYDISEMHYDQANEKLYVVMGHTHENHVVKIDVPTGHVDKYWDTGTTPAFSTAWDSFSWSAGDDWHSEGQYVLVGPHDVSAPGIIEILDGEADTIRTFAFADYPAYSLTQNVNWSPSNAVVTSGHISCGWLDVANDRLYVCFINGYIYTNSIFIGYIDLTQGGPTYDFTNLVDETGNVWFADGIAGSGVAMGNPHMLIEPAADIIAISWNTVVFSNLGVLKVWNLTSGNEWKRYKDETHPDFPASGLRCIGYLNGKLYGGIQYDSEVGDSDKRGIAIIDLATDVITTKRPSYSSIDDYHFQAVMVTEDNKLLWAARDDNSHTGEGGGVLYDPVADTWTLFDNSTVPGLTPSGNENFEHVAYDPANQMIFMGGHGEYLNCLVMFSRDGMLKQSNYSIGEYTTGWAWPAIAPLTRGYRDYQADLVLDPDTRSLWAFWTHETPDEELQIYWDIEDAELNLVPYLLSESPVEVAWSIDPLTCRPVEAGLRFAVSRGDLFDPFNTTSLLRDYLMPPRRLSLRFGENIGGIEYWQPQGTFILTQPPKTTYTADEHPVMEITADDLLALNELSHITATDLYTDTPEDVIEDLLFHYAGIAAADIDLGAWDTSTEFEHQWLETSLQEILTHICGRFGYVIRPNSDDTIGAVKVSDAAAVDHTYPDTTKITHHTAGGQYSNLINQVVVTGEERNFIETLMPEERVGELQGTVGWWGYKNDSQVWYSKDMSRRARYPRLEVIETATTILFEKTGGRISESLLDNSHDDVNVNNWDKYSTVLVSAPDLRPILFGAMAALIASFFIPDIIIQHGAGPGASPTHTHIRVGTYLGTAAIYAAIMVLSSQGNYQYAIHARPVGLQRRTVQSETALEANNDWDLQSKLGQREIVEKIHEPLCESGYDCNVLSGYRMMCHKRGRRPMAFTKSADLRDQVGDTIRVPHPVSMDLLTLFVLNLKRAYLPAAGPGDKKATFKDDIEGWCL